MDTDYEEISTAETLSRHKTTLEKLCKSKRLHIDEVLEEVVSGESLAARPQMMRLLEMVSTGDYAGVVCMDIERLSRGSSMESGYIMQILQVNGCKIITPGKTYDLQNESDEQFTDMKFMFSRYELKTITKRLVRGRNQSASEGKFMGSTAPYGYRSYKLSGEKGNSLMAIPEEASVVRMIFDMYGLQDMGYNAIAYRLNDMHIPARKGTWSQTSICNILTNEVYLGKIRWRREPVKRVVKEGMLSKKRILNEDYELYEGRHEAIITQEEWDRVQNILDQHKHTSNHIDRSLKNPFAGVLYCEKCGAVMKRYVPHPKSNPTAAWFRCMTRDCDCKMVKCEVAEKKILTAMEEWLQEYRIQLAQTETSAISLIDTALETVQSQLSGLQLQQERICEYLEKGIYSVEMFSRRNAALSSEIKQLQKSELDLRQQKREENKRDLAAAELIPATQHILDSYPVLTVEAKNDLWKLVMRKATIYRTPEDELHIHIYPNLPK